MDFNNNKAIYLQISDWICDRVLTGELKSEDRIPSVRELGAEIGVNPNTIMRTYEKLTNDLIIFNKRGIGYFIASDAKTIILDQLRQDFLQNEVPRIRKKLDLLGLKAEEVF